MSDSETTRPRSEKEIFFEALDKNTPEERSAFLDGACGTNRVQRTKVEALLADHFQRDAFMKQPAVSAAPPECHDPTVLISPGEAPTQMIGRYKLLEKIGEGGFGEVWMAEQREPVKRRVALKIIKLGMDSRQIVARFEAERQALAMMDHPNIARIFDAGTTENPHPASGHPLPSDASDGGGAGAEGSPFVGTGRPYFVMELVRGIKITEYCDQNQLPTKDRLDLFIKVCQAIQHAHQKGIIHRDIKPSNILVTLHDGVPVPKVIDFGIAKATQQELTDKTVFTQFQQFIGTPAYISPEQAEMSGLDIDTRADIYSLGVLLYELLVGQTPFDAKEMMKGGIDALRQIIREREPLRPSTKLNTLQGEARTTAGKRRQTDVGKLVHQLQGDLDWIVMKCLEKDRTRRYETANGLASDIQRHLNNEAVLARPPSAAYRFQKLVRRNKLAFAAAALIALVLVLGVMASAWQAVRATRAQRNEAKQREIADEARQNEAQLRVRAQAQELAARQRAYASAINLAQQALALDNLGRAQELLNRQRPSSGEGDLRGWEWRYLWKQCRSDALFALCQETNAISSLAVSADGQWLAVGENGVGGLSIWDVRARRAIVRLPSADGVHAAFSPREKLLAFSLATRQSSTNWDYSIRLWNTQSRETVAEVPLQGSCIGLAFAADGGTLVTSTRGPQGQIALWRMPDGKKLASYSAPQIYDGTGTPFAVARDTSIAAHATPGDKVRVIDLASGRERWSAKAAKERVLAVALSPDGKILATGGGYTESTIRLWDVLSGREINQLSGHRTWVAALMFWPDGGTLASASGDQTIRLWDMNNPTNVPPPRVLRGHKLEVWRLALLPDSSTLVSGCKDGSVYFWDATSSPDPRARITLPGRFSFWAFDPESKSVVSLARNNGSVARWRGTHFQEMESLIDVGGDVSAGSALFSADTKRLAVGANQGRIRVWDLRQRALIREWTNGISPQPFAFLKDGKGLVTVDRGEGVHREWDLITREATQSWNGAMELYWACTPAFSPDERWCLTLNWGGAGLIRDLTTGSERKLELNLSQVASTTFSPDGKLLAAASELGYAKLWDATTFQELPTIRGVFQGVHSVAFSPDSKRLAIGGSGIEAIKLWDVESRQELLTLEGEGSMFFRTAFSPDGNDLGSMNKAGDLHLWRAPSWVEIEETDAKEKGPIRAP